jgi:hypothetical protein
MKPGQIPKRVESYFALYPTFHMVQVFLLLGISIKTFNPLFFSMFIFAVYFQSPIIWRHMKEKYGQPSGASYFGKNAKHGNNWFVAYQLQQLYNSFAFFEKILKIIPGMFSLWLRFWGSNVGEKINWTPGSKIVDRTHLTIGSRVLIGNECYISAHIIKKSDNKYLLYIKQVEIGDDVVLALQVIVSPGVKIKNNAFLEAGSGVYPNGVIEEGEHHERFKELFEPRFDSLFRKSTKE